MIRRPPRSGFETVLQAAGIVIAVVAVCVIIVISYIDQNRAAERCEAAGGVYEYDDNECETPDGRDIWPETDD